MGALGLPRETLSQTPNQNKWGKKRRRRKESKKKAEKTQKQQQPLPNHLPLWAPNPTSFTVSSCFVELFILLLLSVHGCFPCSYTVYHVHARWPRRQEERFIALGTTVIDSYEPPGERWESNPCLKLLSHLSSLLLTFLVCVCVHADVYTWECRCMFVHVCLCGGQK